MTAHKNHAQRLAKKIAALESPTYQSILEIIRDGGGAGPQPTKKSSKFKLNEEFVRQMYRALIRAEGIPEVPYGTQAAFIDYLIGTYGPGAISHADGYKIVIHPLHYEGDPDSVLITVVRPYPLPALADIPMEWDDVLTIEYERLETNPELSDEEFLDIFREVVRYANQLLGNETGGEVGPPVEEDSGEAFNPWEADPSDIDDWKYEVTNGDTVLGLQDWLLHREEAES